MATLAHEQVFDGLPRVIRERFVCAAPERRFAQGEAIWFDEESAASSFSFLCEGCVKLVKTHASGRESIIHLAGPGELLCMSAVVLGEAYCCTALVASPWAVVKQIPRSELVSASVREAEVASGLVQIGARRTITLCRRVDELTSGRVEQRLARLFQRMLERFGEPRSDGSSLVRIRLSRRDLADLCATTIETAIRVMKRLEREGIIGTVDEGFVVSSSHELEAVCERPSQPPPTND